MHASFSNICGQNCDIAVNVNAIAFLWFFLFFYLLLDLLINLLFNCRSVSEVTVIHVDSPSHFFVQHNQQWEDIEDLSTKLNKFFQVNCYPDNIFLDLLSIHVDRTLIPGVWKGETNNYCNKCKNNLLVISDCH